MLYGLSLLAGIGLLFLGGEALIRGAVASAQRMGVSPLLTGLVVVGFGTSAPELVVSVDAALRQQPDIAVGNIVGSNIGNILLILGLCAAICPMTVQPLALRRDGVVVVAASVLFIVLSWGEHWGNGRPCCCWPHWPLTWCGPIVPSAMCRNLPVRCTALKPKKCQRSPRLPA